MSPMQRFELSLQHCAKLCLELSQSSARVRAKTIDAAWVHSLADDEVQKDMVVAYISRFGRFQDALADSLIPKWLEANDEKISTAAENFSKAAKLGIIADVDELRAARLLKNKLTHEYIDDAEEFAALLRASFEYVPMLTDCFNRISGFAARQMGIQNK